MTTGVMLYCSENVDRPLGMHILSDKNDDEYVLDLRQEGPPLDEGIGSNDSRQFNVSVRFGVRDFRQLRWHGTFISDLASVIRRN